MDTLDKTQVQWLLTGIGVIAVGLIYLWGVRARIREGIRKRRRRPTGNNEPAFDPSADQGTEDSGIQGEEFGDLGRITPNHHLADKVLIDVEIRPIARNEPPPVPAKDPPLSPKPQPKTPLSPPSRPEASTREPSPRPESRSESRKEPTLSARPKKTIALTVLAPRGQFFAGSQIQKAVAELGLQLNDQGLFVYWNEERTKPVLSMAHLRQPGIFALSTLAELTTPGLLLFMHLPGPWEEMRALEHLVLTADRFAKKLGGIIGDEQCNRLTNQGLLHLRSEVAEFQRQMRLWEQTR